MTHLLTAAKITKYRKRAVTITANAVNSLLVPVFNIGIAYLVIQFGSLALWGGFVNWLVVVGLGAHGVAWGNKEFLLRSFSRNPGHIAVEWQRSLKSRALLFGLLCLVLLLLAESPEQGGLLILWALGLALVQSLEVFVVYRKDFLFAALVEATLMTTLSGIILTLSEGISVNRLILLFGLTQLIKAALYLTRYRTLTTRLANAPTATSDFSPLTYFRLALPFFLLGFSGMLHSRIDLYAVNIFLTRQDVGQYQVFINLMIYLQSVSLFVLLPFVKSIYRLNHQAIEKMALRLFGLGLLLLIPGLGGAHLLLTQVYQFSLPFYFLLVGGLFVLPIYLYLPIIYALYGAQRETAVLKINLLAAGLNLVLNLLLLPSVGMIGAIIASAIAQWVTLGAYLAQNRILKGEHAPLLPDLP